MQANFNEVRRVLSKLRTETSSLNQFFSIMEKQVRQDIDNQFTSEGAYMGTPWQDLKLSTIQQRISAGFYGPILQRTGKTKRSIMFTRSRINQMKWTGTSKAYKYHQLGTRKMVRRQILGWSPGMIRNTEQTFRNYIISLLFL